MNTLSTDLKWLVQRFRPYSRLYLVGLMCGLAYSLLTMLDPLIIRFLIDDVVANGKSQLIVFVTLAFILNQGGRILFERLGNLLSMRIHEKMLFRTRLSMLRRLQSLSGRYHEQQKVGDILYRFQGDVELIAQIGASVVPAIFRVLTVTAFTLSAMFMIHAKLTLVMAVSIPSFVFFHKKFQRFLRESAEAARQKTGDMSAFLQDQLSAIQQIKLLSRELSEARKFAGLAAANARAQIKRHRTQLLFLSFSPMLAFAGITVTLGLGSYFTITGAMTVGGLVAFYGYSVQLYGPLYSVVDLYSQFQRLGASIQRVVEIEEAPITIADREDAVSLPSEASGTVLLDNVRFGYRPDCEILAGVSLALAPGTKTVLMGRSGSGKSTLAQLIARLIDVQEGAVRIDSLDVREVKLASLRRAVAVVPQDPILFDCTLRENLLMGNPKATRAQLEEAVEAAQLSSVIARLPNGWDEPVGARGGKLSGGEKQRVALARALLQDAKVLILDEVTSALDAKTESALLKSLDRFAHDRTILIISHRPSTIAWAERTLVLSEGKFFENDRVLKRADAFSLVGPIYQHDTELEPVAL